jgi:hypothetical protein
MAHHFIFAAQGFQGFRHSTWELMVLNANYLNQTEDKGATIGLPYSIFIALFVCGR